MSDADIPQQTSEEPETSHEERGSPAAEGSREKFEKEFRPKSPASKEAESEKDLLQAYFCPRALYRSWCVVTVAIVLLLVLVFTVSKYGETSLWPIWLLIALAILAYQALRTLIKRFGTHYRLTTDRLFTKVGILRESVDQVELLRVDDVSVDRTLTERLLGLGTVIVHSTDQSSPELRMPGLRNPMKWMDLIHERSRKLREEKGVQIEQL